MVAGGPLAARDHAYISPTDQRREAPVRFAAAACGLTEHPTPVLIPPRHELIDFHGDQLIAVVLEGDGVAIPLRLLCERIGLDTDAQAERLRSHVMLASGLRVVNVALSGRVRSVMAIIHTKLPFWLATISPEQVNDETRPKLIQYQTELAGMLARLFMASLRRQPRSQPTRRSQHSSTNSRLL